MNDKRFWIYIVADKLYGTLYLGVTSDLARRAYEHREGLYAGFTQKYGLKQLVYYEEHSSAEAAIEREKKLKKWKRNWKIQLIAKLNPTWRDLYLDLNA